MKTINLLIITLLCFSCVKKPVGFSYSPTKQILEQDVEYKAPQTPSTGKFIYSDSPEIQKAMTDLPPKKRTVKTEVELPTG